jgi:hypothetical protein
MKFRVEVICVNDEGAEQRREVMQMERRELAIRIFLFSRNFLVFSLLRAIQGQRQVRSRLAAPPSCPSCTRSRAFRIAGIESLASIAAMPSASFIERVGTELHLAHGQPLLR